MTGLKLEVWDKYLLIVESNLAPIQKMHIFQVAFYKDTKPKAEILNRYYRYWACRVYQAAFIVLYLVHLVLLTMSRMTSGEVHRKPIGHHSWIKVKLSKKTEMMPLWAHSPLSGMLLSQRPKALPLRRKGLIPLLPENTFP